MSWPARAARKPQRTRGHKRLARWAGLFGRVRRGALSEAQVPLLTGVLGTLLADSLQLHGH